MAGLQMFWNMPRSRTGKSPAKILFWHDVRDSLPCKQAQLLPHHQAWAAHRLVKPKDKTENPPQQDIPHYGPTRELPLLTPRTPVRIQNPITKKWDYAGFIVSFCANKREYIVRLGHKQYRRNRHWLKPIEIETEPAIKQPTKVPSLPAMPIASHCPVHPDWFRKPASNNLSEEVESNEESNR